MCATPANMTANNDAGDDHRFMGLALKLAAKGMYTTDPNPRVGCVIVKNGEIIGRGWHERAGGPHAEINALQQAGEGTQGATVYVTLEPCSHFGKTPPCADALIKAGVSRVVAAMPDPNPLVAGKGMQALESAGIKTRNGVLQTQAEALNPGFIKRMRDKKPFVRCKLAMSLDGRTAMANGESKWITGEDARRDVHKLRARSSAILTGINTVLADDPSLNARLENREPEGEGSVVQPVRVVVDSHLRLSPEATLLSLPGRTIVATASSDKAKWQALQQHGAEVVSLPGNTGRVDLEKLLYVLADEEINEVMVEAGPTLNGELLKAKLIDELVIYMAPVVMGDAARGLFSLPGLETMQDRIKLEITDWRAVGCDWRITASTK